MSLAEQRIRDSIAVKELLLLDEAILTLIEQIANRCSRSLEVGGKIIFAGNGGSFADAQHLAAEFVSRFMVDRQPLAALALGTNSSAMSAIGNDYGYEHTFSREMTAIGKPEDVFIAISTSGNSPNILAAVRSAMDLGIDTFGLTGAKGGELARLCTSLLVPSTNTGRIQESHILIGHIICEIVETAVVDSARRGTSAVV